MPPEVVSDVIDHDICLTSFTGVNFVPRVENTF